jgi:hypothetical protein
MNMSLIDMGCPISCVELVVESIQIARENEEARSIKGVLQALFEKPDIYTEDRYFGKLAHAVLKEQDKKPTLPIKSLLLETDEIKEKKRRANAILQKAFKEVHDMGLEWYVLM